ncbi:hypothetical protein NDN08_001707 [Rhodosorus marinus]|uniref:TFIIS N-terminal domain-containing protein n=1 Tax=Rhodosorus marinus TaxID=101924 RepID=A0AAV8UVQ0_9RHOD|nr:hypothetical protein NDN08_001707 [Rhodosorus marinus]
MKRMAGRPGFHLLSCLVLVLVLLGSVSGEADIASRLKGMKARHKELSEKRRNTVDSFRGKEVNFATAQDEVGETEEHLVEEEPENAKLGFRESLKVLREEFSSELAKGGNEETLSAMQNIALRPDFDAPLLSSVMEARIERKMLKMFENFLSSYEPKKCTGCNQHDPEEPEAPEELEDEDIVKTTTRKLRRKLKNVKPQAEPEAEPEPEEGDRIAVAIEARRKLKEKAGKKLVPEVESESGIDANVGETIAEAVEENDTDAEAVEAEADDNLEELGELAKDALNLKDLSVGKLKQLFKEGASGQTLASVKKKIINRWRGVIGVAK